MSGQETLDLSQKILAWISLNEPVNGISKLIEDSEITEDKIKLNIERLYSAGLLESNFTKTLGPQAFVHSRNIKLSYSGVLELQRLIKENSLIKGAEINLGGSKV